MRSEPLLASVIGGVGLGFAATFTTDRTGQAEESYIEKWIQIYICEAG